MTSNTQIHDTHNTQIHDRSLSYLRTGTSIKQDNIDTSNTQIHDL
jgi:hypothetical protein